MRIVIHLPNFRMLDLGLLFCSEPDDRHSSRLHYGGRKSWIVIGHDVKKANLVNLFAFHSIVM